MTRNTASEMMAVLGPLSHREETSASGRARGRALANPTRWSLIRRAQGDGPEARQALGELIACYERSVVHLVRRFGCPPGHTPEDLKQEFFAEVVRLDSIASLEELKGKFRSWLFTAVKNFMSKVRARWRAEVRGDSVTAPLPFELAHDVLPDRLYVRTIAQGALREAMERHRAEHADPAYFERMLRFLPSQRMDFEGQAAFAAELGIPLGRLENRIFKLRQRHIEIVREVVADALDVDPKDPSVQHLIDEELRELAAALFDAGSAEAKPEKP